MNDGDKCSAVILAGGQSSRMGRSKAELPFAARTMLDHIVAEMTRVFEDVIVAVATRQRGSWQGVSARIIVDEEPHRGPVSALENALRATQFDRAFVCSCDVPFVSGVLARKLCEMLGNDDVLIPHVDGKQQMLYAVYRRNCAQILAGMHEKGEHRLHRIVKFAKARIVPEDEIRALDPELLSFFNVNTPEDYQRALKLLDAKNKM